MVWRVKGSQIQNVKITNHQSSTSTMTNHQQSWDNAIAQVPACVEKGTPTVKQVVATIGEHFNRDINKLNSLMQLLVPYDQLREQKGTKSSFLRSIQVQAGLRLLLWSSGSQTDFVAAHAAQLGRKKKKKKAAAQQQQAQDIVFHEMISVLTLAAFMLSQSEPFSGFLKDTLGIFHCCKDTVQRLFDHFEVPNPFVKQKSMDSLLMSTPPKRTTTKRKREAVKKAAEPKPMQPQRKANAFLDTSKVKLTAPVSSRNALLGNTHSRYVGSHFNTDISNLLQQVTVKQQPRKPMLLATAGVPPPRKMSLQKAYCPPNSHSKRTIVMETPAKPVRRRGY
jgi:hypothetical protein